MGLFGGNKKLCPICGNPAAWLLPTKVEGQPLCGGCADKASQLPDYYDMKKMSIEELREFMVFYDGNEALRRDFRETFQYEFGFLGGFISLDTRHGLLRFGTTDRALVFEASNLRSFCILEDTAPLFEGTKDGLLCYQSAIPDRVRGLDSEIDRFLCEQRQYEQMERMDEILKQKAKEAGESYSPNYYPRPDVNRLKPFQTFYLRIELDHPYWNRKEYAQDAPCFTSFSPSITSYLHEYDEKVGELHKLAGKLMDILNPGAEERQINGQTVSGVSSAPVDTVTEIQKYKALLDSGVITEEEFTAKKRQLLGI